MKLSHGEKWLREVFAARMPDVPDEFTRTDMNRAFEAGAALAQQAQPEPDEAEKDRRAAIIADLYAKGASIMPETPTREMIEGWGRTLPPIKFRERVLALFAPKEPCRPARFGDRALPKTCIIHGDLPKPNCQLPYNA